ncbi:MULTISPECIES: hypothetical protein [unclassified Methylobacterium]|jgi:hypothetical protein|uniref:hypothetical protein n=1 Tax=unclassified Methylobacterium TaxID=2615210 RepID=UPI0006AE9DDC|nr:hypothetical protein [Methylobacterium sp. yr596]KOX59678.1 hypothetical protein ADL19_04360 [Streptomyces purpurogeneiscleroticus]SFF60027.1 hypothetical protein SAMN04487844_13059 [Methylobacterium sp. yr596]
MTHRTAHDVAQAFDTGLGFAAFAIGTALIEAKAARREADAALAEDYLAIAAQARAARLTAARAREAAAARHAEQAARRQAVELAAAAQVAILRRRIAERASAA